MTVLMRWKKEILFEYEDQCSLNTLLDENAGHYCEVLLYCTLPSSYMLCTARLNLTDLIVSGFAFIFEIQDCWRQRINRPKGV